MNPVEKLWSLFDQFKFEETADLFHDEFIMIWPQTRELIRGRKNFILLNLNYPGKWRCQIKKMVVEGDEISAEIHITDGNEVVICVGFYTLKDGKIWRGREFWPTPYDAPKGREEWVEF